MTRTLRPVPGYPNTSHVLSGGKDIGILIKPKTEHEFWEYWPKVDDKTLTLSINSKPPVCKFPTQAEALSFLEVRA